MTSLNNQVISPEEQRVIAETVHETLCEFRDKLKPTINGNAVNIDIKDILEGSCFYYAALGTDICTTFYQNKFNTERRYALQAGAFQLSPNKQQLFEYQGYNNSYHCWIAGPVPRRDDKKFEIIDFTARHYKAQVDKISNLRWEREDLEDLNFIWTDDLPYLDREMGIIFYPDDSITRSVYFQWEDYPLKEEMVNKAKEILDQKLKKLNI